MSSNHPRPNRKRSRHDSHLRPDDDDGPPLKRIKLNPDHEDMCQEFKWLSQIMNTIYNPSQHFSHNLYTIQMNEITDAVFFTHIIHPEYEISSAGGYHPISREFNKFMREFYGMHIEQFVEKCYTESNIYTIYSELRQHDASCTKIIDIMCHAIDNAYQKHKQRIMDRSHATSSTMVNGIKKDVQSQLMTIYKNQHNKKMKSTDILATVQLLIADGYIRHTADDLNIPQCISQAISVYYVPISLRCKITQLFENEVDKMMMNTHTTEQNLSEQLDGLAQVFPMLHDRKNQTNRSYFTDDLESFYTAQWKLVDKIIRARNEIWNQQYLLNEIGIMEYTKRIETFMEQSDDNYHLEQKAGIGILIPSYNQCILDKYNGDYNTLVMVLSKPELKRIYRVLMNTNSAEAGKLNAAYKSAHCQ